jgi:hypothetical protein
MRLLLLTLCLVTGCAVLTRAAPARPAALVLDVAPGRATQHGLEVLGTALRTAGWNAQATGDANGTTNDLLILAGLARGNGPAARALDLLGVPLPTGAEALVVKKTTLRGKPALILCGADDRGLMYAALDVAARIRWAPEPGADPLSAVRDVAEQPAVRDRSLSVYTMNRAYWESRFYDERYWTRYFDLLAASRFNRFLIVFGYENGGFLAPPYPYFFATPGFTGVKMVGLSSPQQRHNLAALNRLIELAHDRGIAVSLGIWDHIYRGAVQTGGAEWITAYQGQPIPNSVEGVTSENLSAYTLASVQELLARVPAVDGLQFRVHEESGLKREEMEAFWRQVFAHVQTVRPGMLLEARAKGTPDRVIDTALAQGVNLRIETKYWMEQMGLPYHPTHVNPPNQHDRRHGYADLLRYPQRYEMTWRLWNGGTQRILLWGDPEYVRRYSASTALYASRNWDVQEPLATKMEAQRPDQSPFSLLPDKYRYYDYEFERYWHFYQLWGRLGYNPQSPAELWDREFQRRFGSAAAPHVAAALHRASGVLPMIVAAVYPYKLFPTTRGWAERQALGVNLADYANNEGTDPEQFESFVEAARRILAGGATTKRTPDATRLWFNSAADDILAAATAAETAAGTDRSLELESTLIDVRILAQLARFHARRIVAAIHYNLFKRGLRLAELVAATYAEKEAVAAWRELVAVAGDRYTADLAMGARNFSLCGHWRDELKKLETGLKELEDQCCPPDEAIFREKVWTPEPALPAPPAVTLTASAGPARPGQPFRVTARITSPAGIQAVRLRYRHVTQFEDYISLPMERIPGGEEYGAAIPGDFLVPQWDLMYFIEIVDAGGHGANWPDLAHDAPYVIVPLAR